MFQANLVELLAVLLTRLVVSFCNTRQTEKKKITQLSCSYFLVNVIKKKIFAPWLQC